MNAGYVVVGGARRAGKSTFIRDFLAASPSDAISCIVVDFSSATPLATLAPLDVPWHRAESSGQGGLSCPCCVGLRLETQLEIFRARRYSLAILEVPLVTFRSVAACLREDLSHSLATVVVQKGRGCQNGGGDWGCWPGYAEHVVDSPENTTRAIAELWSAMRQFSEVNVRYRDDQSGFA